VVKALASYRTDQALYVGVLRGRPRRPAPPERNATASGSVSLSAAFCQENRVLTHLEASGSGYTGPSDPRFVELIRNVTFNLFPPTNPNNPNFRNGQPGGCLRFMFC
jgi:hypothetical protein